MKILVIIASIRANRLGERIGKWVHIAAANQPGWEVELADLAKSGLPRFDEPASPRHNPDRHPVAPARRWLDQLDAADGFIIVTPEYNHAIPGILKDAIDYTDFQLAKKPVAIVSYGTVGGARAAEMLKPILIEAKAAIVPEAVAIVGPQNQFDESGKYLGDNSKPNSPDKILGHVLSELNWWTVTLNAGRTELAKTHP